MEKVSLFKELKSGGYDSSLITTFNAYFPFYEEVLLRRLRSCGVQRNAVMIDDTMCKQAMEESYPILSGRLYALAPMNCPRAFHPKIILLLGKKKGLLAIGSHNLTFSGYGFNAELTNVIRFNASNEDSVYLFWTAWQAIQTWLADYGQKLPAATVKAINSTIEGINWIKKTPLNNGQKIQLLYSSKSTQSLWSQFLPLAPVNTNKSNLIGAFFDSRLGFIDAIRNDIQPKKMVVGIQPTTVSVSGELFNQNDITVVDTSGLLDENERAKYIHAKAIYLEGDNSSALIVGSANPSTPAWLLTGSECNAEAVLVRADDGAEETAELLGLSSLSQLQQVTEVPEISLPTSESGKEKSSRVIVASLQEQHLIIQLPSGLTKPQLYLENVFGEILDKQHLATDKNNHKLRINDAGMKELVRASLWDDDEHIANVLIFFSDEIEAITARGNKKKLRDALGTLDTDSPELKVLFNCLDKIIFEKNDDSPSKVVARASKEDEELPEEGNSLVIEWAGVTKLQTKNKRLKVADDLTTLLDAFVYGLGTQTLETTVFSAEDKFGRNEEELIGSDDEEDVSDQKVEQEDQGLLSDVQKLNLCQRRVNTIINKICNRLDFLKKKQLTHVELLPALLAVTSLLKELKQRSKTFNWIGEDVDILPKEAVTKLFAYICECWWGANYGLQQKVEGGSQLLEEVDEIIRLRGQLVWLSWYVGISFETSDRFWEEPKVRDSRLWMNSVYVLLAQMVASDDLLEEEASRICASENDACLKWYAEIVKFGRSLKGKYTQAIKDKSQLDKPKDNTWVLHESGAFSGLRYCHAADDKFARMASVAKEGEHKHFSVEKLLAC